MKCDFCSGGPVEKVYPTPDYVMQQAEEGARIVQQVSSGGGWAACAACAALVDRGDREALAVRAAKLLRVPGLSREGVLDVIRAQHAKFFAHREDA